MKATAVTIGDKYDRLTVVSLSSSAKTKQNRTKHKYLCLCDCGSEIICLGESLRSGNTRSCGCYRSETTALSHMTHGLSSHKFYKPWHAMMFRCYNDKSPEFHNYGGRGIFVCEEWKNSVEAFIEWCVVQPFCDGDSLDRFPDMNGPYCPENCRFASKTEQSQNRRVNKFVTYNGETLCFTEFCRKYAVVGIETARGRTRLGWDMIDAAMTPLQAKTKKVAT